MDESLIDELEIEDIRIPMTKAEFLKWRPDDDFLYEYDGVYAEQLHAMQATERYIVRNIQDAFVNTNAYRLQMRLFEETECWLTEKQMRRPDARWPLLFRAQNNKCWLTEKQMRRPDVALFTDAQIRESTAGGQPVPAFAIELISEHDKANKIERKVVEYFRAGVQILWHIYPELRLVRVLSSPRNLVSLFETDVISAAPVMPDLQMMVDELFAE